MALVVAVAQIAPEKGELARNLDRIAEAIEQASNEGADWVVFPETATTGYFLEGGVIELALRAEQLAHELGARLSGRLHRPIDATVGYYERFEGDLYNSAAYLELGAGAPRVLSSYRKFFLPTYGVFDEQRFVSAGHEVGVLEARFGRVGHLICEDVWHSILPTLAALRGAQVLAVPSASPARGFAGPKIENHDRYERMLRGLCEEHGMFCVNAQLVGFEGGKGFIGGSMVVDPFGRVIAFAPILEETLLLAELDLDLIEVARTQTPLLSDLKERLPALLRMLGRTSP
ncbi:MAG: nitrilase-related carbon-nitrogen hydrolase [Fimbriimonadaceae bacterium]